MKRLDVGQIANTLANLGVLAGLLFVGLQLQLDRDLAERTLLFDATESRSQWAELVRESSAVWTKGLAAEKLTESEYAEFDTLATLWELSHYTYFRAQELVSLDASRFVREWALELQTHPGLLNWWRQFQDRMSYTDPDSDSAWHELVDNELQSLKGNTLAD